MLAVYQWCVWQCYPCLMITIKPSLFQLFHTNKVLTAQKGTCLELETKLKEMEVSDGKKIEGKSLVISLMKMMG